MRGDAPSGRGRPREREAEAADAVEGGRTFQAGKEGAHVVEGGVRQGSFTYQAI
jgi:hypothetical protein